MQNETNVTGRRGFLELAALAGMATLVPCTARAAGSSGETAAIEQANLELVREFCLAWSQLDTDAIVALVSDDFVFQPYDNAPLTHGAAEFRAYIGPFIGTAGKIDFELLRSSAIGPVVLTERIDHIFARQDGKETAYPVAGVFQISNGKIRFWYDFFMPGFKLEAAPAAAA